MRTATAPRFLALSIALGLAGAGVWAAASTACVPGAPLAAVVLEPRSSGPPGTQVTVRGINFVPDSIEVRWNGLDGDRIATATGPDFSAVVTIPQAEAGLYTLLVMSRRPDGSLGDIARAPFEVTGTGGGAAVTSPAPPRVERSSSSSDAVARALGGAALVGVGAVAGALVVGAGRRSERPGRDDAAS